MAHRYLPLGVAACLVAILVTTSPASVEAVTEQSDGEPGSVGRPCLCPGHTCRNSMPSFPQPVLYMLCILRWAHQRLGGAAGDSWLL